MVDKHTKKSSQNDADGAIEPEIEDVEIEDAEALGADKLKKLRNELKACQEEKQQYLDGWQREKADLLNLRRRHAEESEGLRDKVIAEHIEKLLPLCDSFEMAFSDTEAWEKADPKWKQGIEQIHAQLANILKSYDVRTVGEVGEVFNPHLHEALSSAPVEKSAAHNAIVTVYQKGYKTGEKLIRPAKVIVGEYSD